MELQLSGKAFSDLLSCWGHKKKYLQSWFQLVDFYFKIQVLHISLLVWFLSFVSTLVRAKDAPSCIFFFWAQNFFYFTQKNTYTLTQAGSFGLWKKRALWLAAACWACSKHTHSSLAERSWERRRLREHRGLKTAASEPACSSHFTLLPRHHYNTQGRESPSDRIGHS